MLLPTNESLRRRLASAAVGVMQSPKTQNTMIGAGRALDPHPKIDHRPVRFNVKTMTFGGGFAADRANLASDRANGEHKILGAALMDNGKTAVRT